MRHPFTIAVAIAVALGGLASCSPDSATRPSASPPNALLNEGEDNDETLVVDDNRADCPNADFQSIQAAVAAAEPGSKILVCAGTYAEQVTVTKNDLRLVAKGEPGTVVLQGAIAAPEFGFLLLNVTGVLVEGFTVRGFHEAGIRAEAGGGHRIRKNVTTANGHDGIQVANSSENTIEHNTSFANLDAALACGINVAGAGSKDNTIRHNTTFENARGIQVTAGASGTVVFHNVSRDNRIFGILNTGGASGTVIEDNRSFDNQTGAGVRVEFSTGVTVKGNRTAGNVNGIILFSATGNVVTENHSDANRLNGIALNTATGNLVEKNHTEENAADGIRLNNAHDNTIRDNKSHRNGLDGIRAFSTSTGNTIEKNVMRDNKEHDAHDDSVGPGTGGTANFWRENRCKTENRPGLCEDTSD